MNTQDNAKKTYTIANSIVVFVSVLTLVNQVASYNPVQAPSTKSTWIGADGRRHTTIIQGASIDSDGTIHAPSTRTVIEDQDGQVHTTFAQGATIGTGGNIQAPSTGTYSVDRNGQRTASSVVLGATIIGRRNYSRNDYGGPGFDNRGDVNRNGQSTNREEVQARILHAHADKAPQLGF